MHPPGTPRSPYTLTPLHHWPLTAVLAVQARAYRPELIESAHTLAHKIAAAAPTHPLSWAIANPAGELLAYAIALPWHSAHTPQWNHSLADAPDAPADCLYLHDIAVTPTHTRQGLAATLLHHTLNQARRYPQALRLAALIAVQGAHPYWARHGFTPQPPAAPLHSFGPDAIWMTRPL